VGTAEIHALEPYRANETNEVDIAERLTHVVHRTPVLAPRLRHLRERGLGERARRAEEAVHLGVVSGGVARRGSWLIGEFGHGPQPIQGD